MFSCHFCKMTLHKGKILERAIRRSEFPISLLAKKIGKSRQHVYDLFEKDVIPLDTLLRVGSIINHDFSKEIKELSDLPANYKYAILKEPDAVKDSASYWRGKYVELLEKHQLLLEGELERYFKGNEQ